MRRIASIATETTTNIVDLPSHTLESTNRTFLFPHIDCFYLFQEHACYIIFPCSSHYLKESFPSFIQSKSAMTTTDPREPAIFLPAIFINVSRQNSPPRRQILSPDRPAHHSTTERRTQHPSPSPTQNKMAMTMSRSSDIGYYATTVPLSHTTN